MRSDVHATATNTLAAGQCQPAFELRTHAQRQTRGGITKQLHAPSAGGEIGGGKHQEAAGPWDDTDDFVGENSVRSSDVGEALKSGPEVHEGRRESGA